MIPPNRNSCPFFMPDIFTFCRSADCQEKWRLNAFSTPSSVAKSNTSASSSYWSSLQYLIHKEPTPARMTKPTIISFLNKPACDSSANVPDSKFIAVNVGFLNTSHMNSGMSVEKETSSNSSSNKTSNPIPEIEAPSVLNIKWIFCLRPIFKDVGI